ncbi:MAG: tetratricopeptide repeat protein, partial [Bacteroidota bacterium]
MIASLFWFALLANGFLMSAFAQSPQPSEFKALTEEVEQLVYSDIDLAREKIAEQEALLEKGNWEAAVARRCRATLYNNLGIYHKMKSQFDSSIHYYTRSTTFYDSLSEPAGLATIWNNIANVYYMKGDYPISLDYHFKSLHIRTELGDSL